MGLSALSRMAIGILSESPSTDIADSNGLRFSLERSHCPG